MPEIEIRPANAGDIPQLIALDHHYITDRVWQLEEIADSESVQAAVQFREMPLPRTVRVDYPRSPAALSAGWARLSGLLVASLAGHVIGYTALLLDRQPDTAWICDLVVDRELRRKGIGSGLVFAAGEWAATNDCHGLVLEMQPRNAAAIRLANKLGFDFCGYNANYFAPHETGIFFYKTI